MTEKRVLRVQIDGDTSEVVMSSTFAVMSAILVAAGRTEDDAVDVATRLLSASLERYRDLGQAALELQPSGPSPGQRSR